MKKLLSIFLILALSIGFQGCGKNEISNSGENKKITLTMWHIWSQKTEDSNSVIIENVVDQWNKNHPNIQIKLESAENERYKTKIKTAAATNELPDIFYSWGGGFLKPLVDTEKLLPLNEYLNSNTIKEVKDGVLNNVTYNNKIYGLPLTFSIGTFYCNTELFEKAGIKIPDTYDELLYAVKKFREKGITPLLVGEQDKWTGIMYYDILALREVGIQSSKDALNGNDRDNVFLKAAYKLKELIDLGAFDEASLRLMRDESEILFKEGKIPMYYTGNWLIGELQGENSKVKDKIVVKTFPIIKGGKGNNKEFLGGASDYLMVNNDTKYKKEAVEAIEFICKNVSKQYYEFGSGLPAWKDTYNEKNVNKLSKELKHISDNGNYMLYWDIYLGEKNGNKHKDLVYKLFQKSITPEEFAREMNNLEE
ncbi:extracellular solute-binding protein [Clostridium thermopalmarium]|uniref:Multiple sugar-binding protein n=1 Tax=Clostridium thermopalmarium DSM 5974 TaxID=1121340 RepID=A0A2T0AP12_9CLOT|nr:extracellular solute-binding protein [Clostridium thermopalmarium]PRR70577.1 Multiple sugar-binding protein precursor [Clostridium thermopalmarium DSM 5974]PVZ21693.1 raffinose/stachyose/melibiose transport system substrate-binding protein [Clostridium thermopalmarium DSM 5974]